MQRWNDVTPAGSSFCPLRQRGVVGWPISPTLANGSCHHERPQAARDLHLSKSDGPFRLLWKRQLSSRAATGREGSALSKSGCPFRPIWRTAVVITSGHRPRGICISRFAPGPASFQLDANLGAKNPARLPFSSAARTLSLDSPC